jgi:hypothetical protein
VSRPVGRSPFVEHARPASPLVSVARVLERLSPGDMTEVSGPPGLSTRKCNSAPDGSQ